MTSTAELISYVRSNYKPLSFAFAIGIAIASAIFILVLYFTKARVPGIYEPFIDPSYEKELNLFKNLKMEEQQEYLGLSRDLKLAKYGNKLI